MSRKSASDGMLPSSKTVEIGSGALRNVPDWRVSQIALDRVLSRAASHKPEAVRELGRRKEERFRREIEIGAILFDFCEQAGLSITHQYRIEDYIYDFCVAQKLLIEVDETRHSYD